MVEQSKISAMMEGKEFTGDNIKKMYQMVQGASEAEEKTKVMKHSVFFVGQLPLGENHQVDIRRTQTMIGADVPTEEVEECLNCLLEGLTTQKLLLQKEDGSYEVNTKYEKSVIKVRKIVRAWEMEKEKELESALPKAKKMYQMGTKYYHAGDYEQAAACFMNTAQMAEYRMGYYSLATMYRDGKGVDRSLSKALHYARKAVCRGARIAEALEEEIMKEMEI
ncbi:MAG: hypothetical protein MRZ41_04590 [Eubacterium sp.]|nr:hypothetical protein [Eubacterium sp.]